MVGICVLGRRFQSQDLQWLQGWIDERQGWSRRRLSVALAEFWNWRNPRGQLRDMASRLLLGRLEALALVRLPPRQKRGGLRQVRALLSSGPACSETIRLALGLLQPLGVRLLRPGNPDRRRLVHYFQQHHYLGYPHPLGQLHYLVADRFGRDLAGLLFGPAAWKCRPRDEFIGWTAAQCQAHLGHLTNNSRWLMLPWVKVPHLASHLLGLVLQRLPADWHAHYGQAAVLVESFVEAERFEGTCYRASNWIELGLTQGRSRHGAAGVRVPRKRLYVWPLTRHFRQRLCP